MRDCTFGAAERSFLDASKLLNCLDMPIMSKRSVSILSLSFFGLALLFGAGSVAAGDGKSCGGKKMDGESAVVVTPNLPRG